MTDTTDSNEGPRRPAVAAATVQLATCDVASATDVASQQQAHRASVRRRPPPRRRAGTAASAKMAQSFKEAEAQSKAKIDAAEARIAQLQQQLDDANEEAHDIERARILNSLDFERDIYWYGIDYQVSLPTFITCTLLAAIVVVLNYPVFALLDHAVVSAYQRVYFVEPDEIPLVVGDRGAYIRSLVSQVPVPQSFVAGVFVVISSFATIGIWALFLRLAIRLNWLLRYEVYRIPAVTITYYDQRTFEHGDFEMIHIVGTKCEREAFLEWYDIEWCLSEVYRWQWQDTLFKLFTGIDLTPYRPEPALRTVSQIEAEAALVDMLINVNSGLAHVSFCNMFNLLRRQTAVYLPVNTSRTEYPVLLGTTILSFCNIVAINQLNLDQLDGLHDFQLVASWVNRHNAYTNQAVELIRGGFSINASPLRNFAMI